MNALQNRNYLGSLIIAFFRGFRGFSRVIIATENKFIDMCIYVLIESNGTILRALA